MRKLFIYILIVLTSGAVSCYFESAEQDRLIERSLGIWEADLGRAMANNQMFLIDRIITTFRSPIIEQVVLKRNGQPYFSLPAVAEVRDCQSQTSRPIQLYGEQIGTLDYCKSVHRLIARTPLSLSFWLLLSLFFALISAIQIFSYRARLDMARMRNEIEKKELLFKLASQVSHDLKSPCTALTLLLPQMKAMAESHRVLAREAVQRITDIANTLLRETKEQKVPAVSQSPAQVELIPAIVDSLISEKRLQYRHKTNLLISANLDASYGAFAKVNSSELKRAISNLIDNSCEALGERQGHVEVSVLKQQSKVVINVKDNGPGIPKQIANTIGQRGVTFGKESTQSGSGLGVWHAKNAVESFSGHFEIQSSETSGATMIMSLPSAPAPAWFGQKIQLSKGGYVVSLDDDVTISEVFKQIFNKHYIDQSGIRYLAFSSAQVFSLWVSSKASTPGEKLFLIDYELLNQATTGLDVIEQLGIGPNSILVTSRYEEQSVRSRCESLGVRLIPKGLAPFVPIEIVEGEQANETQETLIS